MAVPPPDGSSPLVANRYVQMRPSEHAAAVSAHEKAISETQQRVAGLESGMVELRTGQANQDQKMDQLLNLMTASFAATQAVQAAPQLPSRRIRYYIIPPRIAAERIPYYIVDPSTNLSRPPWCLC